MKDLTAQVGDVNIRGVNNEFFGSRNKIELRVETEDVLGKRTVRVYYSHEREMHTTKNTSVKFEGKISDTRPIHFNCIHPVSGQGLWMQMCFGLPDMLC